MEVAKVSSSDPSRLFSESKSKDVTTGTGLGYDAFLQLLIAQMNNQDPLEPMKSSDYVAQLATFSQVEKSVQMNERLADLLAVSRLLQAEGLIGRTVSEPDGERGVVASTRISGGGVFAILENGREIRITDQVVIS
jgi:flagellar basal-body rod modification protein FlgD